MIGTVNSNFIKLSNIDTYMFYIRSGYNFLVIDNS